MEADEPLSISSSFEFQENGTRRGFVVSKEMPTVPNLRGSPYTVRQGMHIIEGGDNPQPQAAVNTHQVTHVRTALPKEWSARLDHLSVDLSLPKTRLLQEGVLLLLRYHGRAQGLPDAMSTHLEK